MADTISAMAIATRRVKKETRIQPMDITRGKYSVISIFIESSHPRTGRPSRVQTIREESGDSGDDALVSR
jgi:hypothetical protein